MYPLVRELAADGIPVTVTCRVLKLARQPYYRWLACPVTDRRAATRRIWRTRCSTRIAMIPSSGIGSSPTRSTRPASACPSGPCGDSARRTAGGRCSARSKTRKRSKPGTPSHDDLVRRELHRRRAEPAVARGHHRAPDRRRQALPLRDQGRVLEPDRRLRDRRTDEGPPRRRRARDRRRPPR